MNKSSKSKGRKQLLSIIAKDWSRQTCPCLRSVYQNRSSILNIYS